VQLDVLVLGSGVAGLSAVVRLAEVPGMRVGVLTKAELAQSATRWAQGGVAAVLGGDEDSTDLHMADTLAAGAGLCDVDAVRILVDEGPARVRELIALGAVFDREAGGDLARAREGGHSTARVLHAGGAATGAEVERALVAATEHTAAAVLEQWFALDLLVDAGRCAGVIAVDPEGARQRTARRLRRRRGRRGDLRRRDDRRGQPQDGHQVRLPGREGRPGPYPGLSGWTSACADASSSAYAALNIGDISTVSSTKSSDPA